jgi:diguanylate cyclase (GGDEF)-like protein/PAS domain S-box-containing protein
VSEASPLLPRPQSGAAEPAAAPPAGYAGRTRYTQLEYEAVLANASIGIAFTRERRFFLCNPKFAEMLGWKAEELIGQPGEAVYPSRESYEALGAIAVPVLAAGRQLDIEWEFRRKDGSTFLARVIAKAIGAAQAQQGTIWIAEDITERRRQADELARLLREQDAILNTVSLGICFVKDRRIVRCTRRFEQMHGYAPGELAGQPTSILYASEAEHQAVGEGYARLAAGATYVAEIATRRKDGSQYWSRVSGSAVDPSDPSQGSVWLDEDVSERRHAEEELQRVLAEQQALLDNVVVGIAFVRERKVVRCNRRFEALFGLQPGEALGAGTRMFYFTEQEYAERQRTYAELDQGRTHSREQWLRRKDGSGFWCRMTGRAVQAGSPAKGYAWLFEDISERRRADERVRRLAAEQQLILDNALVGIAFVRQRVFERCNPRFEEMLGYAPGELAGQSAAVAYVSEEAFLEEGKAIYRTLAEGGAYAADRELKRKDGTTFWARVVGKAIDPAHASEGSIWSYDDITAEREAREALERAVAERTAELQSANRRLEAEIGERRQAESRAQHLADHDPLTGLPNRRLLEDRLTQAIALSHRNRKLLAAMFVDLDRFKAINDSLGHSVGDALLKEVAQRLVKQLRVGDTVCRIGGDEFVVVLPEIKRSADAANVAQKAIETLSQPVTVDGRELNVTPSIGISIFPDDGRDAEALIRNADAAMYHAKERGRAHYQFFTEQMNQAASRRRALENDLRRALREGEFRVAYRPVTELAGGRVAGHEAQIEWRHPSRGLVAAAEFVPLAEETGLILRIGEWLLGQACRWAARERAQDALPVGVNLWARQFNDPRLLERVSQAIKESGLAPRRLELEIAESTLMQQTEAAHAALGKLKALGVSLAVDHFGAGASSLAALRRFPLDKLKIDRSFVTELPQDADSQAVVAAIAGLAHNLGLKVVAEGVESDAQKQFLRGCGCDYVQA